MRIVVQNSETHLFFAGQDQWLEDREAAFDFERVSSATHFLNNAQDTTLQIVICFNDADYDYWLGVDELGERE